MTKFNLFKSHSGTLYILTAGLIALCVGGSIFINLTLHRGIVQDEKLDALRDLGLIRADLEGALNSRLLLGRGIVSYVTVKHGIEKEEFNRFAEKLINGDPMILNLSLVKGTTIISAFPLQGGNKAVIGVDLAKVPDQRDSIAYVMKTKAPSVISSVRLIQGGIGTICRIPVLFDVGTDRDVYWGQVSIVLRQDVLLKEAGLVNGSHGLDYSLCEKNSDGSHGRFLYGEPALFARDPVCLDVKFPFGGWNLAAVPREGWGHSDATSFRFTIFNILIGCILSLLVFFAIRARRRVRQLESILPMCSSCKKIRNEAGNWDPVETLFGGDNRMKITHSLCPDCAQKLYGDQAWFKNKKIHHT